MNEKQNKTLEIIKEHFTVEIEKTYNVAGKIQFLTINRLHGLGTIYKNGNFKFNHNRYQIKNNEIIQIAVWGN